jgi:hypothetical protein
VSESASGVEEESLATGDYVAGVSDLDLVALVTGPVGTARQTALTGLAPVEL